MNPFPSSSRIDNEMEVDEKLVELLCQLDEMATDVPFDVAHLNDLSEQQRAEFVSIRACLEALGDLRTDELFSTVLNNGATISLEGIDASSADNQPLQPTFGRYRIERLIGEGGFARVFLATDSTLNRKVALKIPKSEGMASEESRARFRREAEAAATLAHPAIVPVFESGNVGEIQFIAFDYCDGTTLAALSNQQSLNFVESSQVVQCIAEAVGHAHDRGVIHRDLKPGNILIEHDERPIQNRLRITDFGLARFRDSQQTDLTISGTIVGTPAYMSPEQARGEQHAGGSTDIYSIGVMLYELLTGHLPHRNDNLISTLRAIEDSEPQWPRKLNPNIPKDLEAICLKCLEKSPADRYATAYELSEDLQRWIHGRSVLARRANLLERTSKWVFRNKALSSALLVAFAAITGGLIASQNQYYRTLVEKQKVQDEKQIAEQERERSDRVVDIIVNSFRESNPNLTGNRTVSALEVLQRTKRQLESGAVGEPLTRARLFYELSRSFFGQADYASSIDSAAEASEIYHAQLGAANSKTIYALRQMAKSLQFAGQFDNSISIYKDAFDACEQHLGSEHPLTIQSLNYLGIAYIKNSRKKNALRVELDAYERARRALSPGNKIRLSILRHLAAAYRINGELEKSVELNQESLDAHQKTFGMSRMTLMAYSSLAKSLEDIGRDREAKDLLLGALVDAKDKLGASHPQTLRLLEELVDLMKDADLQAKRKELSEELVSQTAAKFGEDHPSTTLANIKLTKVLWDSGEKEESLKLLKQFTDKLEKQLGESHPKVLAAQQRYQKLDAMLPNEK